MAELNGGELEASDFLMLMPKQSRAFDGFHAYFFHELPFNAAYIGDDCAVVQEGAKLKAVDGGIDEPIARVLGFALGRALGLQPRREPATNLMALGTTGVAIDAGDVERARRVAKAISGTLTFAEASEAARAAGQTDRAARLNSWLGEIARAANPKGDSKSCGEATASPTDGGTTAPSARRGREQFARDGVLVDLL